VKHFAKRLAALNLLAFAVSAVTVWLLDRSATADMLDIASYVGLGMGAVGALMFVGSTSGSSVLSGFAASAADQPSRMMDALWSDRTSGISTGALLVVGGISWIGIAWLLSRLFSAGS
jgi:hypothetical protein